ncbi:TrbG/VirB9 family P-type conjugative transfer protein [Novosphingobium rosa]|uniref:TrbG/VirB9 family P-type conjugative transfer protein n=1 Tax=Novosphingobium rosa TaxID=76978 RepID=UPI0012EE0A3D|nr:TrbG/VirB9 family P-type conjugative transfer protein [Novosphingobium rosa]
MFPLPNAFHRIALLAALTCGLTAPAQARETRIMERFYDPARVFTVHGHTGIETTITFRADEHIENIAVGDSTEWQVTPNKRASLVFVKPMKPASHTNMTVITDRRTYLFDLVARPREPGVYLLQFSYPPDPPPPPPPALTPVEAEVAQAGGPPEKSPADLHFDWLMTGYRSLWPARVFDDGQAVWLSWPKGVEPPAILSHDATAGDGPLNYRIDGDYIVIDGLPAHITLRKGKQTATLSASARLQPDGRTPSDRKHKSARDEQGREWAKPFPVQTDGALPPAGEAPPPADTGTKP